MRVWFVLAAFTLIAPASAQPGDDAPKCSDLVVIAKMIKQEPMPIPDIPDVIIMRWTWNLDIEVKEVVFGPTPPFRMRVRALMHTYFRSDSDYWLMSFTRGKYGYELDRKHLLMGLMKDREGHVVLPVPETVSDYDLAPDGLLTRDYKSHLQPLSFGPNGIAWMKTETDDGHFVNSKEWADSYHSGASADWLTENNGWIVPKRGLTADTLKAMVRETMPRCPTR